METRGLGDRVRYAVVCMNILASLFKCPPVEAAIDPNKYACELKSRNASLKRVVLDVGKISLRIPLWVSIDDAVVYSIIGQGLSLNAAVKIIERLLIKFDNSLSIIRWAGETKDILGGLLGVSQRKRKTLFNWNRNRRIVIKNGKHIDYLKTGDLRKQILSIWGMGDWSADMIDIFYLGKMNIWPRNDAGIKRVAGILFRTSGDLRSIEKYVKGIETVAAIYFWHYLDRKTGKNLHG